MPYQCPLSPFCVMRVGCANVRVPLFCVMRVMSCHESDAAMMPAGRDDRGHSWDTPRRRGDTPAGRPFTGGSTWDMSSPALTPVRAGTGDGTLTYLYLHATYAAPPGPIVAPPLSGQQVLLICYEQGVGEMGVPRPDECPTLQERQACASCLTAHALGASSKL